MKINSVTILILYLLFCFLSPLSPLSPPPVLNKGQCVTKYYRWMQKNGGYIWIQSSATIAINAKNANEKNIIWVNYLLRYPFCFISLSVINCTLWLVTDAPLSAICSRDMGTLLFFLPNSKKWEKSQPSKSWVASLWGPLSWSMYHPGKMEPFACCCSLDSKCLLSPRLCLCTPIPGKVSRQSQ